MDLPDNTPSPAQVDMGSINTHYLLSYEESIVPYSLRLPTYRSSYIRRFHPYPRYITSSIDSDEMYDEDDDPVQLDLSILMERPPPYPAAPADEHLPENHVERDIREQGLPRLGDRPCNDNPAEVLDIFPAEGQNIDEEPPSTLSGNGQCAPRPEPLVVIETRGELQNEGEDAHERVIENLEHENRDEEQPELDGEPLFVVNPDKVHAELDEEDTVVEDLRRLGFFCRSEVLTTLE